ATAPVSASPKPSPSNLPISTASACSCASSMARAAKTVTPCFPPACWKSSAPTFAPSAPVLPGCFPPGVLISTSPPAPCRRLAARPGNAAASASTLPHTVCDTPSPLTCWTPAPTPASSRPCWATPASTPPPATLPFPRPPSVKPHLPWTCCSSPPSASQPNADAHANPGVARHLSTIRPRLPAVPLAAPAPPPGPAGHRNLPHSALGRCGRMVPPVPILAHPLSLLPQPPLPHTQNAWGWKPDSSISSTPGGRTFPSIPPSTASFPVAAYPPTMTAGSPAAVNSCSPLRSSALASAVDRKSV